MTYREPQWNKENKSRKRGDTTFKQCGWCKYQGSGTYRVDCMLEGACSLLGKYHKVEFDTECYVAKFNKDDFRGAIESKRFYIKEARGLIKRHQEEIKVLRMRMLLLERSKR